MALKKLRDEIDKIDTEIIMLLSKRLNAAKDIAKYKMLNDETIFQPEREKEIFEKLKILAKENKLDINFVNEIFNIIIKESKKIQENIKK